LRTDIAPVAALQTSGVSLIPSAEFQARARGRSSFAGPSAESVSFWITRSSPGWAWDGVEYRWPQLCFGRMTVRVSKHAGGMLRIDLGGPALEDRCLTVIARCPETEVAPNGRMGVLVELSWQPKGVRLSLQNGLRTEHRLDLC
jgi:hypothetical protein